MTEVDDENICFYCDSIIYKNNVEMDHFPIPKRFGGTSTVTSCKTCHNMKDRSSCWNIPESLSAVNEVWGVLSREGRIFLAKLVVAFHEKKALRQPRETLVPCG